MVLHILRAVLNMMWRFLHSVISFFCVNMFLEWFLPFTFEVIEFEVLNPLASDIIRFIEMLSRYPP